ncbi:hypothetical protein C1645_870791 [Glomus cerebriforme]|uniref:Uncharacterized protein n=1 Tax=Glomus cerebriforme TaxID=658196 RepID=A0A397TTC7_9GLOM|nr:hypothetical protein C1645_870791 [Glomus cerebriforme]
MNKEEGEKLPIYKEMERRNNDTFEKSCQRCKEEDEDWIHIWNCKKNNPSIYELIDEVIEIQIKEMEAEN